MGVLSAREPSGPLPLVTIDLDGVVCAPMFGIHGGTHRDFLDAAAPPPEAYVPPRWLRLLADHARFDLRRPLPDAEVGLVALGQVARIVILTGRRTSPRAWLRLHRLARYVESVVVNDTALASPHFKLAAIEHMKPLSHLDDDPRTAQLIAEVSGTPVFLRDWPDNRNLEFHPRVLRVSGILEFASRISEAGQMDAASRSG
jgi:hypothetical protein